MHARRAEAGAALRDTLALPITPHQRRANNQSNTEHLVQNTNQRIHPPLFSSRLSGHLLGCVLKWLLLQRAQNAPTLGPQQEGLCLQRDAAVTTCGFSVSFCMPLCKEPSCWNGAGERGDVCATDVDEERGAGPNEVDIQNKQCSAAEGFLPSRPTAPLFFRIPCTDVRATARNVVCSTVHTDFTSYAKPARRKVSQRLERQDGQGLGQRQRCRERERDEWRLYRDRPQRHLEDRSVAVTGLFLPRFLVINTMPLEADIQLRGETISDGV